MHSLEEGVDVKGIQRVFHGYGDILGCKAQIIKVCDDKTRSLIF
jgi:hypothetical protein